MEKKYLYEINFIRAIACLLVVMVHVAARFYVEYREDPSAFINIINQFSRVGTPLFAVISGFLLYNQNINRVFNTRIFLKSRVVKIVLPFIIWSVFYLFYKSLTGRYSFPDFTSREEFQDFIYMFLIGRSHSHLYFIIIVIQFYILFLFLRKTLNIKTIVLFTIMSFYINYILITNKLTFDIKYIDEFINSRSFLLQWIYYFMLGILCVKVWPYIHKYLINIKNSRYMLVLGGMMAIFIVLEYYFHQSLIASNRNILNMVSVPIAFLALTSLYYRLIIINQKMVKWLIKLGNMSMGIYLIHPFVIFMYLDFVPYDATAHPLLIIPYFIAVITICVVILKLLSYLPFYQYFITLVKTNEKSINSNIKQTQELIKSTNDGKHFNQNHSMVI